MQVRFPESPSAKSFVLCASSVDARAMCFRASTKTITRRPHPGPLPEGEGALLAPRVSRMRIGIVLLVALAMLSRTDSVLSCSICGCCRVEAYDDPISPYIYGENPLYTGEVEVAQSAPIVGGAGSSIEPIEPGSWTLVLMPDTQHYSQTYPAHFNAQTQFIKDNAAALNLKYVLHEGDIVNIANQRASMDQRPHGSRHAQWLCAVRSRARQSRLRRRGGQSHNLLRLPSRRSARC